MSLPNWILMLIAKIQARHPLLVARVIHLLTSKKGKSTAKDKSVVPEKLSDSSTAGIALTRNNGVLAANRAAGIPNA